jgi:hypothetical protein
MTAQVAKSLILFEKHHFDDIHPKAEFLKQNAMCTFDRHGIAICNKLANFICD